jgi:acetyltransferase-like isoleucine patch superfamily enzyme
MKLIDYIFKSFLVGFNYVFNWISLRRNGVTVGTGLKINGRVMIQNMGQIIIGNSVIINSGGRLSPIGGSGKTMLCVYPGAILEIGDNVGISNTSITTQQRVTIESGVMIGASCNIWDTDFHSLDPSIRGTVSDKAITKPVLIRKNAFIGAHSIILKGAVVGQSAVLGAGSVTSSQIGPAEIWSGNPARFYSSVGSHGKSE